MQSLLAAHHVKELQGFGSDIKDALQLFKVSSPTKSTLF